jgi:hypothetical protein
MTATRTSTTTHDKASETACQVRGRVRARECTHGHPMTPENSYRDPSGKTRCRRCNAADGRMFRVKTAARVRRMAIEAEIALP